MSISKMIQETFSYLFISTIFQGPSCNATLIRIYKCFYINESKTNIKLTYTTPHPLHKYSSPNSYHRWDHQL